MEIELNETERQSEIMNLIGYGLAKFDLAFAKEFDCKTKTAFNKLVVELGLAKTEKAVSNRQDSFDPYFDNGRKGWWQRNQREHVKLFIDSLFGNEDAKSFSQDAANLWLPPNPSGLKSGLHCYLKFFQLYLWYQ